MRARIVSAHGRHYMACDDAGKLWQCYAKGKKKEACVGDWVQISEQSPEQARIEEVEPRKNLLYRSDQMRSKQFAANVDLVLIIVAGVPAFSDDLLGRALAGARAADVSPIIILNKCDLEAEAAEARERLSLYQGLGFALLEVSAVETTAVREILYPILVHKTALLLGQSAMGKSSILNALVPFANALTQEHSQALNSGRHTTTSSTLYQLKKPEIEIIDSPGFQAFGLYHLDDSDIVQGFPEFNPYLGGCRFYNCHHLQEPGCAVRQALDAGSIEPRRYDLYVRLIQEISAHKNY